MKILVIDDNMRNTDALLLKLRKRFIDAEVVLKNNLTDGLKYILENLNYKMIVVLDYDLGSGNTATEVFLQIREKTSLLYVIIITAKYIDDIPNKALVEFINKDALAFIDRTISLEDKLNLIEKAIHALDVRVDCVLEQWINRHTDKEQNEPYLITSSGTEHTLKSILNEIRLQTELGKSMERKILMLAVHLLTQGKEKIDD